MIFSIRDLAFEIGSLYLEGWLALAARCVCALLLFAAGTSAQTQRAAGRLWQRSDGAHPADVLVEGRRCGGARQGRQHRGVCRDVSVG